MRKIYSKLMYICTHNFFFQESRLLEHLPVYNQYTSISTIPWGRMGKKQRKEKPKKEAQCFFIWFFCLPSASNCHGVF